VVKCTKDEGKIPVIRKVKGGFLYAGATIASMSAIKYISMPTQILAKSIKILPGIF